TPKVPEDLEKHVCIVFGAGAAPNLWKLRSGGETVEIKVAARFTVNDPDIVIDVARAGAGIAAAPAFTFTEDFAAGKLREVLPAWSLPSAPLHILYPTARHLSPKVSLFADLVAKGLVDMGF